MKKLRFKKDTDFRFYDWNGKFEYLKMTIKKDTEIKVYDEELEIRKYSCNGFENYYHITLSPYEYDNDNFKFEILEESENDSNDAEEYRQLECFIDVNVDDVEVL